MELSRLYEQVQRMTDDFHWAMSAPEVRKHVGMYVGIYHRRVVGVGLDEVVLARQAAEKEKCDWEDIVVVLVPSFEPLEIPH